MNKWQIICPLTLLLGVGIWLGHQHAVTHRGDLVSAVMPTDREQSEVNLIKGYYSEDITEAERSLLSLIGYYSNLQVPGVGGTLALTHTRLFGLYSQLGRTNDAALQRELALQKYRGGSSQDDAASRCSGKIGSKSRG